MNNKPIKIRSRDFSRILVNSDNHYNHNRSWMYEPRGFSNINDHDKWIDDSFAALLPTDLLIMLGDNLLNSSKEKSLEWFRKIPCKKLIIFGNHNSYDYPIYKEALADLVGLSPEHLDFETFPLSLNLNTKGWGEFRFEKYKEVYGFAESLDAEFGYNLNYDTIFLGFDYYIQIDEQIIYLRHMAPTLWEKYRKGSWCLCGHSHGTLLNAQPDSVCSKILDVGIDNSKKYNDTAFFSLEEIRLIMENKHIVGVDKH